MASCGGISPDRVTIAIPARLASTRLPGKMLMQVNGRPLIEYTWRRACASQLAGRVVIATDDEAIAEAARRFGAHVEMTAADCASGTDRIYELVRSGRLDADIIVNVQGDEPEIDPSVIDMAVLGLAGDDSADITTPVVAIESLDEYRSPGAVKVAATADGRALYFSRAAIPFVREGLDLIDRGGLSGIWRHIGLYSCRREALVKWASAAPSLLEGFERLEQLRALELGLKIKVVKVARAPEGIDTLDDFRAFQMRQRGKGTRQGST